MIWVWIALAPILGALVYGGERVMRARMQRRQGPPLLQPFYDMFKLLDKRTLIVHSPHALLAVAHFAVLWFCIGAIFLGWNLLYIIFLHLFAQILLILAGYSVRSVYSHVGANRELLMLVAYEPVLILVAVGLYLVSGSFEITDIMQQSGYLPKLLPLFAALAMIVPIKVKKSPFDIGEAHQEIVGGVEIEYSGVFYEFLYMSRFLEYLFIYSFVFLFGGVSLWLGSLLVAGMFLLVNLVDNATARVKTADMVKIIYSVAITLAVINILGVLL
ncbi:respiratory-chain NADH dehydrogenase subunit 1 [Sulfuricurvum kujiense DSM 16994]|uniref:Respiratory-chain NADH dehydrogenase subunit 1 n=1 Tax=Sulfuricurvum kujiense (strain ATCC BAA-921 / DSM 16994 / JCM 11577 / YK-1) TaxID=709032 RepID=E4U2V8_SULKY|nr:complex I subunit 1 family protein [Sulfuricurvum kujiense]ADR34722.1 respiratory-chain NADH dehydrogenase subunit 1 [Sulfuricurvum kujiense DSM 16994]